MSSTAAFFFALLLVAVLFAGGDTRAEVAMAPAGPSIDFALAPAVASSWTTSCSFRHPTCIHSPRLAPPSVPLATLASADRAWDVLTGALGLPAPDTDLDGVWHVYLVDGLSGDTDRFAYGRALLQERDPRTRFDSGTSFALVDRATPLGCPLDLALARALSRACLWRAAPATGEASARAQAEVMAHLATPCAASEADLQEFQSYPERALVDPSSSTFDRGASLFFDWLDATLARDPGLLVVGLWALAPTRTPPGAWRWNATPTAFDVLGVSVKRAKTPASTLEDLFVRFALERARVIPAARLAWRVPWPTRARRLASPEPVSPTGASYVLVDRGGAPAGAKLRMEAQWEHYARMRWVVVKLDVAGRTMAELPVTSLDRGTQASLTVEGLEGVDRVLIVGVNVGSTEHPFDPNQGEWEPHGWLLTVEAE